MELFEGRLMGQRLIKNKKGAAMVELAIILPILLVVLFGIIEFGFILYDKALITNASREGARAGIVFRANATNGNYEPFTVAQIQGFALTHLANGDNLIPPGIISSNLFVEVPDGNCTQTEDPIRVRVRYTYNFLVVPNFITSLAGQINLIGETIMRCE